VALRQLRRNANDADSARPLRRESGAWGLLDVTEKLPHVIVGDSVSENKRTDARLILEIWVGTGTSEHSNQTAAPTRAKDSAGQRGVASGWGQLVPTFGLAHGQRLWGQAVPTPNGLYLCIVSDTP
ncbi:MAG: hypothetical protein ACREIC_00440, partial [Limisphaerales bacterium]